MSIHIMQYNETIRFVMVEYVKKSNNNNIIITFPLTRMLNHIF